MYVLIVDGAVAQYPYTIGNLRRDNPQTSFPKRPSEELLQSWGMERVTRVVQPTYDYTKNINESTPAIQGGQWAQIWLVTDASAEEITQRTNQTSDFNRNVRDRLIGETDWWASSDLTMTSAQTAYRQALRDITSHANWPHLDEADWPTKP
jgi:hypothetical protein